MVKLKNLSLKNLTFLIGLILTISLLWPLFAAPYFTHHDDVQTIRLFEMDKCIKDGQIPCRWVPDLGGLYGYPLFNYYAPFPYYYGEVFYLINHSLIFSAKIMFATAFLGSFLFMYLLGRKLWGGWGGALSAIFYSYAPYHAVDFYVRGAMEELWALMLFPAVLWATFRLKESQKILNLLVLSFFVAILILSHNLSAMLFLPVLLLICLLLFYLERDLKFLKFLSISLFLGILMAAFYWFPMITEKNLVHVETMTSGYFSYTEHFKGFKKLFLERSWGWGASVREVPGGEKDGLSFQIGGVHLLGALLSLVSAKIFWRKNRKVSVLILFFLSVTALSIFMIHPRSEFIWKLFDPLKYLQFPWRLLMLIIFFISLLSGSIFSLLDQKKVKIVWIVLVVLVVVLNFSYFRPEKFLQITDQQLLTGESWDRVIKRSIFDFLPIYAKEPPRDLASTRYEILTGDTDILNYKEGTNWITFQTNTKSHSIIRLSQYYFPNWKINVDGKEIQVDYENSLGLMTFILGIGQHKVDVRLHDTQGRILGNFLSSAGFVLFIILALSQISKIRRWVLYYIRSFYR